MLTLPPPPPVVPPARVRMTVSASHGRLYVSGPDHNLAHGIPSAALNERRGAYEMSLTLPTLAALRRKTGLSYAAFSELCTADVITWAERVAAEEKKLAALHAKVAGGWRRDLPWRDMERKGRLPFDHQQVMATVACEIDGTAFLCQMGTGKTRAAIEAMSQKIRDGELDLVVVLCPKGVMGTWARECTQWADNLDALRLGYREGRKTDATIKARKEKLHNIVSSTISRGKQNVIVINYDVVFHLEEELAALCKHLRVGMVCDEMHKISDPTTRTAKTIIALTPELPWRLGMTGTPVRDKTGEGLWSQWYFIDLGDTFGANYVQYRREYFEENPWTHERTPKPGALDAIGQRLRKRALRYTKEDCLDLPPKTYEIIEVDMTPEQAKAYRQMEDDLVAELRLQDGSTTQASAATQLVSILRLSEITSGYVPTDRGLYLFDRNPKLEALGELVDAQIDQQQILLWAFFRENHEMMLRRFARYEPLLIRGGMSQQERDDAERMFNSGERRLLIGQQQAGGTGLNLQAASLAAYYSQQYSIIDREQSEDRCHRSGSERHQRITIADFCCRNTIDYTVIQGLREKRTVSEIVVDLKALLLGGTA